MMFGYRKSHKIDSDEKLMLLFSENGDDQSLAVLYDRYYDSLVKYVYWLGAKKGDADDIVQSCFLKLLENRPTFDMNRSFKVWIYVIVKNQWLNDERGTQRRRSREEDYSNGDTFETSRDSTEDTVERLRSIEDMMRFLPTEQAEIIALKYSSNFSLEEISQIQSIPIGTAKSRLFNALKKLTMLVKAGDLSATKVIK